jgi:PhnB protein
MPTSISGIGRLQLGDPNSQYGLVARHEGDFDCYSLAVYVADVDAVVGRAVAAGASVREQVQTFVSGDRFGSLRDPFGIRWSVMTRVEDISPDESTARIEEWAKQQA